VAPAQQTKKVKKSADNINAKLALVIKSGKYQLGYKSVLKAMRSGKCASELVSLSLLRSLPPSTPRC